MYNVLADFHHAALLNSLILLFEGRLGGNVYRPIGMEWAQQGFWKVYDHPATQAQFLGMEQGHRPADGSAPLNQVDKLEDEVYYCHDISGGGTNKAITLETFFKLKIDIVIASIPQHIEPFRRLCNLHPNHPKLIYQIGNSWNLELAQRQLLDGILSSAKLPIIWQMAGYNGKPLPAIEYHQEFNTNAFKPEPHIDQMPRQQISSFVNCFNVDQLFAYDWQIFREVEQLMPDWQFNAFGGQCRNGSIGPDTKVAEEMWCARFIWHTKNGGDGYGHVIHSSAACARPLIVKRQYYIGKMGDALIKDGETAIVIDALSPNEIKNKIEYYSEQERWQAMCQRVRANFEQVVDFDTEFLAIKHFLAEML